MQLNNTTKNGFSKMGQPTNPYGKIFLIPQDPNDYEFLLAVERKTKAELNLRYGLLVDYDWQCNTVANCTVESIIGKLSLEIAGAYNDGRGGVGLNFFDLFSAMVSVKTNEKAEKGGNINILFEPGPVAIELIEVGPEDPSTITRASIKDEFGGGTPEDVEMFLGLDYHVRHTLANNHSIAIQDSAKLGVFAITYTYIKNIFVEILQRLSAEHKAAEDAGTQIDEILVSVNFNDNIEIHGTLKDDGVLLSMRPGMNAKLLIKNDELTEHTMGDLSVDNLSSR